MYRFGETKVTRKNFYGPKKAISIWDVNVDDIVISKLVETKTNFKYLTGYLGKVIIPLVLTYVLMLRHLKLKIKTIY